MEPLTARYRVAPARRGFTLAEVLVVLVILAIGAALLYPRLTLSPARGLRIEADRLARAVEMATRLAQWKGVTLGVSIDAAGYRFWEQPASGQPDWRVSNEETLEPRRFDPPTRLAALSFSGVRVAPGTIVPFRPSGRNEPLAIALVADGASAEIRSDLLNRVSVAVYQSQ